MTAATLRDLADEIDGVAGDPTADADELRAMLAKARDAITRQAALRDEIQQERTTQDNLAADHAELGHDDQSGRCYGAVAALDRLMAVMDRMEGEQ
jgi:hypothetical protein